jgi:hypothetical protein
MLTAFRISYQAIRQINVTVVVGQYNLSIEANPINCVVRRDAYVGEGELPR